MEQLSGLDEVSSRAMMGEYILYYRGRVIGGIYEETDTSTTEQVPLLGDIPVLGYLFKSNIKSSERREMLVFITPRIVADSLTLR